MDDYYLTKDKYFLARNKNEKGRILKNEPLPYQLSRDKLTIYIEDKDIATFADSILSSNSINISKFLRGDKHNPAFYVLSNDLIKTKNEMFYSDYIAKPDTFISKDKYMKLPD